MVQLSKRKTVAPWLGFLLIVISVCLLYGLDKMSQYVTILKIIVTVSPLVICIFIAILWAIRSERSRAAKVIGGIVLGSIASAVVYYRYLNELMKWIDEKQEFISMTVLVLILLVSLVLTLVAVRRQPK